MVGGATVGTVNDGQPGVCDLKPPARSRNESSGRPGSTHLATDGFRCTWNTQQTAGRDVSTMAGFVVTILNRTLAAVALAVTCTGCIDSSTIITINRDGSGTMELTTLVNRELLQMLRPDPPNGGAAPADQPMFNAEDLRTQAERMGGLTLRSAEPIRNSKGMEGLHAVFSFNDIRTLRLTPGPMLPDGAAGPSAYDPTGGERLNLSFTASPESSTFTLASSRPPLPTTPDGLPIPPEATNPNALQFMKPLLQGLHVMLAFEFAGSIVKTNAPLVNGARVVFMEFDMDQLMNDPAFPTLMKMPATTSFAETKALLAGVNGITISDPVVSVEFK